MKWQVSSPQRLIAFLQEKVPTCSGKQLKRALEANFCRVNGHIERFASSRLEKGDRVELASLPPKSEKKSLSLSVLFEDEFFKIVDKPAGWICHDEQARRTFGPKHFLVHRLDKDTTGLLLIAKDVVSRDRLMELFEKREIHKQYLALVDGIISQEKGVRESCFVKKGSFEGQTIWGSGSRGSTAITHWKKLATGAGATLVQCEPYTGRTHQIRVHLAEMGHPILIDRQYAKSFRCSLFVQRTLLHAKQLDFVHPFTQVPLSINAPLPSDFQQALKQLQIGWTE